MHAYPNRWLLSQLRSDLSPPPYTSNFRCARAAEKLEVGGGENPQKRSSSGLSRFACSVTFKTPVYLGQNAPTAALQYARSAHISDHRAQFRAEFGPPRAFLVPKSIAYFGRFEQPRWPKTGIYALDHTVCNSDAFCRLFQLQNGPARARNDQNWPKWTTFCHSCVKIDTRNEKLFFSPLVNAP